MNTEMQQLIHGVALPWAIHIGMAIIIFVVGRWLAKLLVALVSRLLQRSKLDAMLVSFFTSILNALLLLLVVIAALEELGVDTTSLVALLGAAGLAVGLALQGSLQNFAAGVMLILFRPFKAGDYVEAAGTAGVVEEIGIFSTRMRTGDNREVIVPNGGIYKGNITNFSARDTRRIDMVFGIGYDADLRRAREIIEALLAADERILADPAPLVAVAELAESSVNFNVRPWVNASDYWPVRYDLTEKLKLAFDEAGISIPYPQMDVHVHQPDD
jgi:small conductance mechanosensitive channel